MSAPRRALRGAGPPTTRPVPTPPKTRPIPVAASNQGVDDHGGATETSGKRRRGRAQRRRKQRAQLPEMAVVLVGPMAAGKTSLGKRLARELGVSFADSDAIFARKHGSISDFFAVHGESEFRRIESELIAAELAVSGTRIFALGGGAVLHEGTRNLLANHPVILLMTTQSAVLRTANIAKRPLLRDDPNAWGRILAERKAFYDEVADVTFRTDRATKDQLTERAAQWVRSRARAQRRPERKSVQHTQTAPTRQKDKE